MKLADVYLLTHSPAFLPFTYQVPEHLRIKVGDLVAVPFRTRLEVGVVAQLRRSDLPSSPPPKPVLASVKVPTLGWHRMSFGSCLLILSHISLCSPGEMFAQAVWRQANRRVSLSLSRGSSGAPSKLASRLETVQLLLGRGERRLTPSLLKKLHRSVGVSELVELIASDALSLSATVGLETAEHAPASKSVRQPGLFPDEETGLQLDPDFALVRQARQALKTLGNSSPPLAVPVAVRSQPWQELFSKPGVKALLEGVKGNHLLLLPTQWHVDRFLTAIPERQRKQVLAFEPDMKISEMRALARRLAGTEPLLVVGKRSAHFLLLHAAFARISIFDPTDEAFSSEQFPRYDTLVNCLLLSALTSTPLTLLPLAPLPLGLGETKLEAEVVALDGLAGARIDQVVKTIARHARHGKQLLVYNNALGTGQEVFCSACQEQLLCQHCGRATRFHAASQALDCPYCGHREPVAACPTCGSRQLGVEIIGVEGLVRRLRKQLRHQGTRPAPRVGALFMERRKRIRVPNLARTEVLIGTSTLLTPLEFYRPQTIIYVAQDIWQRDPGGNPEHALVAELTRLKHLYDGRIQKLIVLAPRALAEALTMQMGKGGQQARGELEAIRRQYQLPPFNVQVDFTMYGKREKVVLDFAEEMYGQLEFSHRVLDWQQSRVLQRGRDEGFVLRGRVTLDRFSAGAFTELRRRGKGKRLDLILAPRYY